MKIEVSVGEIVDKLSILDIKRVEITDTTKLINVEAEYYYLYDIVFSELNIDIVDYNTLLDINKQLWDIEDSIRLKEKNKEFDNVFIHYARLVYITNDMRAEAKKQINKKYGSLFIEEKSYENY